MDLLTLNIWVRSENERGIFPVKIYTVHDLQVAIKNKMAVTFRNVDAFNLALYKPKDPVSKPYEENLSKLILSDHGKCFVGADELSEVFPIPPPKRDIHLIVGSTLNDSFIISIQAGEGIDVILRIKDAEPDLRSVANHHIRLYKMLGDENDLRKSLNRTNDGEPLQGVTLVPNFLGVPVLAPLRVIVEVSASTSKLNVSPNS